MSIVQLDKMTLYGAESQQGSVIERLQDMGCVHLVDLATSGDELVATDVFCESRDALIYLLACPQQLRQVRRAEKFDRENVVEVALKLRDEERDLSDERDELIKAIRELEPWGEFKIPANGKVGDVSFAFNVVPLREVSLCEELTLPWQVAARDHRNAYIVVLGDQQSDELPGCRVELDPRPLSVLRGRLEEVEERQEELQHQRAGLSQWNELLASALDQADDEAARVRAGRQVFHGSKVYALQGWVPRDLSPQIQVFARDNGLALTIQPPGPRDQPPTLLQNPESVAGSEGLVTFYKMPDYRSWDPSIIAYLSFAIFFAMIIADAGYGLIFAIVTCYFWRRMGSSGELRRGRNVIATIVIFTIVYGIMCGSYFGIAPADSSILSKLKILDAQSQSIMMPLTIIIGVIHLSIANVVTAWINRGRATALASLGWVVVMVGATLAGIGALGEVAEGTSHLLRNTGTWMLIGGLVAVFLFSSERPLLSLSIKNHIMRLFDGLAGLTGLSGLFGDVLSYLRLFALGLSSAKLGETFNNLGVNAWDEAGFGVIAAIAIVIIGHTLNILLGIMGGVVHGLRLNCIEFFKWCLPEEGYKFKAFAKKAKQR